jgi:hypothetical protein
MVTALPLFHSSKARRSSALISFSDMTNHQQLLTTPLPINDSKRALETLNAKNRKSRSFISIVT